MKFFKSKFFFKKSGIPEQQKGSSKSYNISAWRQGSETDSVNQIK